MAWARRQLLGSMAMTYLFTRLEHPFLQSIDNKRIGRPPLQMMSS
jgi:hypothetical protein